MNRSRSDEDETRELEHDIGRQRSCRATRRPLSTLRATARGDVRLTRRVELVHLYPHEHAVK